MKNKIIPKKESNFLSVPTRLDPETVKELDALLANQFKKLKRSAFIRYAVEFCLRNRKFIEEVKRIE
jgi:hypothetical protein